MSGVGVRGFISNFILALLAPSAFAVTANVGIESIESQTEARIEASEQTTDTGLGRYLGISYFGEATGPSIGSLNTPTSTVHAADQYGEAVQMNLYNDLRLEYKTRKTFNVSVSTRFELLPFYDPTIIDENGLPTEKKYFNMLNSRVGLVGTLLDNGEGFTIESMFMAELPVSSVSSAQNMLVAPRVTLSPNYDLPNSRWTLGSTFIAQTFFYKGLSDANAGANDIYFYFGPYAYYKLGPKWSGTFQFNAETTHAFGASFDYSSFILQTTNVQLGMNYKFSQNFSINPYIQVPVDNIQLRTAYIGANLAAILL